MSCALGIAELIVNTIVSGNFWGLDSVFELMELNFLFMKASFAFTLTLRSSVSCSSPPFTDIGVIMINQKAQETWL